MNAGLRITKCMPLVATCALCGHVETAAHRDDDLRGFVCPACAEPLIRAEVLLRAMQLVPPADDQREAA
jgi:hypothetical protein